MTIAGFNLLGPRRAVAWCDTECYRAGLPSGETNKSAINAAAGMIGMGAGSLWLLAEGAAVVQRAADVNDALDHLPHVLRAAARVHPDAPSARSIASLGQFLVLGFNPSLGRLAAHVFRAVDNYEPALVHSWSHPVVHSAGDVLDADSARATADDQLAIVRRQVPAASGGRLIVCEIDGAQIVARTICHFPKIAAAVTGDDRHDGQPGGPGTPGLPPSTRVPA